MFQLMNLNVPCFIFYYFRFRVESMDISENDVRIKSVNLDPSQSMEKLKPTSPSKHRDSSKKSKMSNTDSTNLKKNKPISRSQSVSSSQAPKITMTPDYSYDMSASTTQLGSFSTMTGDDLNNWKQNVEQNILKASSPMEHLDEPTKVTVAKDSSKITVGFNVNDDK